MSTKISWTDESWNPVVGCTKVSAGCKNCYAERMAYRLMCMGKRGYENAIDIIEPPIFKWSGVINCLESVLDKPLHWRKPRRIFVGSMTDIFHKKVPFEFIKKIWDVAAKCPQHILQFLTKRPDRMLEFTQWMAGADHISIAEWPRNCWLGVTVENQKAADERIPILLQIPAAVRSVSVEPMLGEVNLTDMPVTREWVRKDLLRNSKTKEEIDEMMQKVHPDGKYHYEGGTKLDWVIAGCESGSNRRECKIEWVRDLVSQCKAANVPVFVKQLNINGKVERDINKFPPDLRLRQYPKGR